MADYSVRLLGCAEADLAEICAYLTQFYPGTPSRFLEALDKGLSLAANNPRTYPLYEGTAYRKIIVQNYIVFYQIDDEEKAVKVYRILHGKRDIPSIIAEQPSLG